MQVGGGPGPGELLSDPPRAILPPLLLIPVGLGLRPYKARVSTGRRDQGWSRSWGQIGHGPSLPEGEGLARALDQG